MHGADRLRSAPFCFSHSPSHIVLRTLSSTLSGMAGNSTKWTTKWGKTKWGKTKCGGQSAEDNVRRTMCEGQSAEDNVRRTMCCANRYQPSTDITSRD